MNKSLIIIMAVLMYVSQSNVFAQQLPPATVENIQAEYKSLAEVKPVLRNTGNRTIYLLPKECGEAQLSFLDGKYGWDSVFKDCPDLVNPIAIKPGEVYHIPSVVMRIEEDESKYREEKIGIPGKYTITISYSFNPTYRDGSPELRRSISKEFRLVK